MTGRLPAPRFSNQKRAAELAALARQVKLSLELRWFYTLPTELPPEHPSEDAPQFCAVQAELI